MFKTPSRECVYEIQPLEGNSSNQHSTQYQKRRFSEFPIPTVSSISNSSIRRRASEVPRPPTTTTTPASATSAAGIVCSNTDLISILSSLTSSATEINRCGEDGPSSFSRDDGKSNWSSKTTEQKRNKLKSFRSNSFDVSILHGTANSKQASPGTKSTTTSIMAPSNWFTKRHQPMWKKQKSEELAASNLLFKFDKSKVVRAMKDSLNKSPPSKDNETRHKVVWDDTSGTKVDAQVRYHEKYLFIFRLFLNYEYLITFRWFVFERAGTRQRDREDSNCPKRERHGIRSFVEWKIIGIA